MQTTLSFIPENLLNQNEINEPKPSTQFQSIQNPLSRKDPGLPTLIYTPNVLSENILINFKIWKQNKYYFSLFPGYSFQVTVQGKETSRNQWSC